MRGQGFGKTVGDILVPATEGNNQVCGMGTVQL